MAIKPDATRAGSGAQTVQRAIDVLRFLASGGADGWSLSDVTSAAGLTKGTAHRLLSALIGEELVEQEEATRRYRLRVDLLGLRPDLDWYEPLHRLVESALLKLADELGDTVFMSARTGFDALCVSCESGSFPIRTFPYTVGERRPLGVGAGGLAMLSALDPDNVDRLLSFNRGRLRAYQNFAPHELLAMVERTQRDGYSLIDGLIVPGAVAIGLVLVDLAQRPILGISAAGIADRMPRSRWPEIVAALERTREDIYAMIRADLRHAGARRRGLRRSAR